MRKSSIFAGLALLLAGAANADAADLNGGSIKDGGYGYSQPAIGAAARFYVRGDFTWASQGLGSINEAPAYNLSQPSIASAHGFGIGAGYYFSPNVRLDVTHDWRSTSDVHGSNLDSAATVRGTRNFGIKSDVTLINAYYDFDSRNRFSPYLGVGLGLSRNQTSDGTIDIVPACAAPACLATFGGATKWAAAGAVMAGFSAKLHERMYLDAGYRFMYLGDTHTGDVMITRSPVVPGAPTSSPEVKASDLYAHEFRVGIRYDIR